MYVMDWNEVMKLVIQLAGTLKGQRVWGIPRGGQLIATLLAYHGCVLVDGSGQASVIIDDICCTGKTLNNFRPAFRTQRKAALVIRQGCCPLPDYWVMLLNVTDYVLFPYENETEVVKQITSGGSFRSTDK